MMSAGEDDIDREHAKLVFDLMMQHRGKIEGIITITLGSYEKMCEAFDDVAFDGISASIRNYNPLLCRDFNKYMFYNVHFYARKLQTREHLQQTRFKSLHIGDDVQQYTDDEISNRATNSLADIEVSEDEIERINCALDAFEQVSILIPSSGITEFELHIVTYHVCYDMTFEEIGRELDNYPPSTVRKYFNIGMDKLRRASGN